MYKVEWTLEALQGLEEIGNKSGKELEIKIRERIEKHLASHPFQNGLPMKGTLKGLWRYRCLTKYRVIYRLVQKRVIIEVLDVGHRDEDFYEKFKANWGKIK